MPRPSRPRLTRDAILHAALDLADAAGVEALTMRTLARQLGVDPMSIYHYIESKAALLDALTEVLIEEVDLPKGGVPWDEWIRIAATKFLEAAERHPKAFAVLSLRPVSGQEALARFEAFAEALDDAGFTREDTWAVLQAIGAVLQGFARLVASPSLLPQAAEVEAPKAASPDPSKYRVIAELVATQAQPGPEETFRLAIELLIDGLASRAPAKPGRRRRRR